MNNKSNREVKVAITAFCVRVAHLRGVIERQAVDYNHRVIIYIGRVTRPCRFPWLRNIFFFSFRKKQKKIHCVRERGTDSISNRWTLLCIVQSAYSDPHQMQIVCSVQFIFMKYSRKKELPLAQHSALSRISRVLTRMFAVCTLCVASIRNCHKIIKT